VLVSKLAEIKKSMKRRTFMRYVPVSLATTLGTGMVTQLAETAQAQGGGVTAQWLGHTCVLFSGGGQRVLVNPFRSISCTRGLPSPRVAANLVMISSRLMDEGFIEILPGRPKLLFEAGSYDVGGLKVQGVKSNHDRVGGFRFGDNVCWAWSQGGVRIVHLGGIASAITIEQKILFGKPDLLFIPVGGSDKAYNAEEAKATIAALQPRIVIPTHYRTGAADPKTCTLSPVDDFLKIMAGTPVRRGGGSISVSPGSLPSQTTITVLG
jgi:L-ascorbate metabolism protein UlaG (beta-lactamase superfamily)